MSKKRSFYIIAVIFWMILIFSFSAKSADESTQMSHSVGRTIGFFIVPNYRNWSDEEQKTFAAGIDHPVRKCAHAAEYAVLGMLLMGAISEEKFRKKQIGICFGIGVCYAAIDEFHQLFVAGRAGRVTDVLIDSVGVTIGICFVIVERRLRNRIAKYFKV